MIFYHLRLAYKFHQLNKTIGRTISSLEGVIKIAEEKQSRIQEMRIKLNESNSKLNSI